MARRIVWNKAQNCEVPFNPLLLNHEGKFDNDNLEWRDVEEKKLVSTADELEREKADAADATIKEANGGIEFTGEDETPANVIDPNVDAVANAILALDEDDPAHWTKSGLPDARVLAEHTGLLVTKELRDAAWAEVKRQRGLA